MNKYDLNYDKLFNLKVNRTKIKDGIFLRDNQYKCYIIADFVTKDGVIPSKDFTICIYDENVTLDGRPFKFHLYDYETNSTLIFKNFFEKKNNKLQNKIQEKFLIKVEELIDNGVLYFEENNAFD